MVFPPPTSVFLFLFLQATLSLPAAASFQDTFQGISSVNKISISLEPNQRTEMTTCLGVLEKWLADFVLSEVCKHILSVECTGRLLLFGG